MFSCMSCSIQSARRRARAAGQGSKYTPLVRDVFAGAIRASLFGGGDNVVGGEEFAYLLPVGLSVGWAWEIIVATIIFDVDGPGRELGEFSAV